MSRHTLGGAVVGNRPEILLASGGKMREKNLLIVRD